MAVERANVCVIMIDAVEGFTEQDSKVAGIALDQGKACIIAVNKWDAVEKDGNTMKEYRDKLANDFSFMSYAPIMFISAKTGQRIDKLYEMISFVHSQNSMRISTGKLNEVLAGATARVQPPTDKGKRLKIFYMTQASTRPPTFVFFVNNAELFHFSYQRYLKIKSGIFLVLTELLSDLLLENEEKEINDICINYFGNNFLSSRKFEFCIIISKSLSKDDEKSRKRQCRFNQYAQKLR